MGKSVKILVVDLFCGAGGTTTGFLTADPDAVRVIACVNHDPKAIANHALNHPHSLHLTEDVRTVDVSALADHVRACQAQYPGAKLVLWASLECTNFSKAKGGLSRDQDSRSLAMSMFRYLDALDPDAFMIENVREFMAWGPMIPKTIPASSKKGTGLACALRYDRKTQALYPVMVPESASRGRDYIRWCNDIQEQYGYRYDYRILNAADYGGRTTRTRYFGMFSRADFPLCFPARTHAPKGKHEPLEGLQDWLPVGPVLDLHDLGRPIFGRKKPLAPNSLRRILAGLKKYSPDPFLSREYSGDPRSKSYGLDRPASTLTTSGNQTLIQCIVGHYTGGEVLRSVDDPSATVKTGGVHALVSAFTSAAYGGDPAAHIRGIDQPAYTQTAQGRGEVTSFLTTYHSHGSGLTATDEPSPTVTAFDRIAQVSMLLDTAYDNVGRTIDQPAQTLVASFGSKPIYLTTSQYGPCGPEDQPGDCEITREIKALMRERNIAVVFSRMLRPAEGLRIQGFPADYRMVGTARDRMKFVGNSVEVNTVAAWVREILSRL